MDGYSILYTKIILSYLQELGLFITTNTSPVYVSPKYQTRFRKECFRSLLRVEIFLTANWMTENWKPL